MRRIKTRKVVTLTLLLVIFVFAIGAVGTFFAGARPRSAAASQPVTDYGRLICSYDLGADQSAVSQQCETFTDSDCLYQNTDHTIQEVAEQFERGLTGVGTLFAETKVYSPNKWMYSQEVFREIVPNHLIVNPGQYLYMGKAYGFYVDTYVMQRSGDLEPMMYSDILIIDADMSIGNAERYLFVLKPLVQFALRMQLIEANTDAYAIGTYYSLGKNFSIYGVQSDIAIVDSKGRPIADNDENHIDLKSSILTETSLELVGEIRQITVDGDKVVKDSLNYLISNLVSLYSPYASEIFDFAVAIDDLSAKSYQSAVDSTDRSISCDFTQNKDDPDAQKKFTRQSSFVIRDEVVFMPAGFDTKEKAAHFVSNNVRINDLAQIGLISNVFSFKIGYFDGPRAQTVHPISIGDRDTFRIRQQEALTCRHCDGFDVYYAYSAPSGDIYLCRSCQLGFIPDCDRQYIGSGYRCEYCKSTNSAPHWNPQAQYYYTCNYCQKNFTYLPR